MSHFLPKLFRWVFTVLAVLTAFAAVGFIAVILVDPTLPPDARFGPVHGEVLGQPATLALRPGASGQSEPALNARAFNGSVIITRVDKASGAIELLKRYGLPLLLIYAVFFAALFELLRRLFRNVGRGDSFTPQSVRAGSDRRRSPDCFLAHIRGRRELVRARDVRLSDRAHADRHFRNVRPPAAPENTQLIARLPFGSPVFLSGLLVLALANVAKDWLCNAKATLRSERIRCPSSSISTE